VPCRPGRGGLVAGIAAPGACAALVAAFGIATPLRAEPEPAATADAGAVVSGSVRVIARGLFGRLREQEDRSGVLVYLTGFQAPPPDRVALLRQHDQSFEPRVLPIVAGQTVSFPNEDPIYHNVFSVSSLQPFDLGQYKAGEAPRSQLFPRPGLVPVYCNIHPKMISYVVVLENGAFTSTDAKGAFEIRGVPAGPVTLNAWVPGSERASRGIELAPGGRAEVELELQVEKTPPHKRKDGSRYPEKRRRY
jgi:hypothetical protein